MVPGERELHLSLFDRGLRSAEEGDDGQLGLGRNRLPTLAVRSVDHNDVRCALADPTRARQVVSALLVQALRHANAGERLSTSVASDDRHVFVVVESNQAAPSSEPAAVLMQVDQRRAADGTDMGSGLELPLSLLFAEAMGGTLSVVPVDGRLHYRLALPAISDALAPPRLSSAPGKYVVVLDPCARSRRLLFAALEVAGVESVVAATGADALLACATETPAAVVIHDGPGSADALRALRSNTSMRQVPIVAWTTTDVLGLPHDLIPDERASKLDGASALLARLQPILGGAK